jgi:hypothetical protein
MFTKMATINFGPHLNHQLKSALHYATVLLGDKVRSHELHTYDEDDCTLFTHMDAGEYTIEGDLCVFLEKTRKVHAGAHELFTEYYGWFRADSIETIQNFFERADEYTNNKVNNKKIKDKIKVLAYDYQWECDTVINKKTFSSIHLPPKVLNDFLDDVKTFFSEETKKRYEELELNPCRIYGLYGPPGTGKTTLIHTIASHYSMNIATLSFDQNMTDRSFKSSLKKLPKNTILCLEDVDALFREDRKSEESYITFSGIINALDGLSKIRDVVMFMTTNHINKLDPALKRRIDYFIKFDFCVKSQVKEMFDRFVGNEHFDLFWSHCSNLKVTPSILQKFFTTNLHKKFDEYVGNLKEFVEGEHGLETTLTMYT